jgi:hypothetical protein
LAQAGLVPPDALDEIKAQASPGELDKVASQARALREWFRGFVRAHMGQPLTADAFRELEPLNWLLKRDETFKQFVPRNDGNGDHRELRTSGAGARRNRFCRRSAKPWRNLPARKALKT